MKKVSGIGIGHYGIEYRRYSKQSIGIGHHGIVPSLIVEYTEKLKTDKTKLLCRKI